MERFFVLRQDCIADLRGSRDKKLFLYDVSSLFTQYYVLKCVFCVSGLHYIDNWRQTGRRTYEDNIEVFQCTLVSKYSENEYAFVRSFGWLSLEILFLRGSERRVSHTPVSERFLSALPIFS